MNRLYNILNKLSLDDITKVIKVIPTDTVLYNIKLIYKLYSNDIYNIISHNINIGFKDNYKELKPNKDVITTIILNKSYSIYSILLCDNYFDINTKHINIIRHDEKLLSMTKPFIKESLYNHFFNLCIEYNYKNLLKQLNIYNVNVTTHNINIDLWDFFLSNNFPIDTSVLDFYINNNKIDYIKLYIKYNIKMKNYILSMLLKYNKYELYLSI